MKNKSDYNRSLKGAKNKPSNSNGQADENARQLELQRQRDEQARNENVNRATAHEERRRLEYETRQHEAEARQREAEARRAEQEKAREKAERDRQLLRIIEQGILWERSKNVFLFPRFDVNYPAYLTPLIGLCYDRLTTQE